MTKTLKRAAAIAAWLAVVAFLLGVLFRAPLERAAVTSLLDSGTGLAVELDDVQNEPGGIVVLGARARSTEGALALLVPRLELKRSGGSLTVDVDRAQVNATATSWPTPLEKALTFAHRFGIGDERILVRVHRSALQLGAESAPQSAPQWSLGFGSIEGSIQRLAGVTTFDLTGAFSDGLKAYPLALRSDVAGDVVTDRWSAAQLPLAPICAPLPSGTLRFTAGTLNDIALAYPRGAGGAGIAIQGSAHVSGVAATLTGDRTHQLNDLHGSLMLAGEGLATPRIAGQIDGIPFDMVAELHGLDSGGHWLTAGNRDLQQLAQLLNGMADQPELTSVHLETTAPGIAFGQYGMTTEHGPLAVQLLAIDPREPTLHFDTALSNDRIVSGGERTSAMGLRTGAVGGVNGDYFDIGRTYQPQGLLIKSGELLRGPTDRMALLVHRDGSVTFGEFRMRGTMHTLRGDFPVTQLNNWPAGDVTVITPAFGKTLPPAPGVTFAALVPLGSAGTYRVESVTPMTEPVPVRFGLAFGQLAHAELHPGEEVDLQFALDPPAGDVVAGIGGGPLLLRDGEWYEDPHAPAPDERDVRWPVVALAKLNDGSLLLVAVDGRHPERSVGMTRPEFADLLHDFGAQDAMALDSGGSVTMVSRAPGDTKVTVRNVPSDNSAERWVSDGLFVYSSAPQPALLTHSAVATVAQPTPSPSPSPSATP